MFLKITLVVGGGADEGWVAQCLILLPNKADGVAISADACINMVIKSLLFFFVKKKEKDFS